jgi:hypothetical protein
MTHIMSGGVHVLTPVVAAALLVAAPHRAFGDTSCDRLATLSASPGGALPQVTLAQTVAAGGFAPAPGTSDAPPAAAGAYAALPPFCRVALTLRPGPASDVKAEV